MAQHIGPLIALAFAVMGGYLAGKFIASFTKTEIESGKRQLKALQVFLIVACIFLAASYWQRQSAERLAALLFGIFMLFLVAGSLKKSWVRDLAISESSYAAKKGKPSSKRKQKPAKGR